MHLPVWVSSRYLAEARGGGEGSCRSILANSERGAGKAEVGVIDDVECIYSKLETKTIVQVKVFGSRCVEANLPWSTIGVTRNVSKAGSDDLGADPADGVIDGA